MNELTPHDNEEQHEILNFQYLFNKIHPTAIIGDDVVMGKGNIIGAYVVITGKTIIGNNNKFESFCVVGSEPEHKAFFGKENKGVIIGDDNVFREYVTINAGCETPTAVGHNVVMLRGSHCGHDALIDNDATISCNVLIGGHSYVGRGANLGLGAILHQFSKIGAYSMIGMGTIVTKKSTINCFGTYVGNPAKYIKENDYQKQKFNADEIRTFILEFENVL